MRGGNPAGRLDDLRDALPPHLKDNPFFDIREETHFVPPWDRIRLDHIMPAIDYALEIAEKNLDIVRRSKRKPTFENTIEALEQSNELAWYFLKIAQSLPPGDDGEAYDEIMMAVQIKYDEASAALYRDPILASKVKSLAEGSGYKKLKGERRQLCDLYSASFSGKKTSPEKQQKIQDLENRISELGLQCQSNIYNDAENRTLIVHDGERLRGLPPFLRKIASKKAARLGYAGAWAFNLNNETYTMFMQTVHDRGLRKRMWQAHASLAARGQYDNRPIIIEMIRLQQEHARLTGYRNYTQSALIDHMAGKSRDVARFLDNLRRAAKPVAKHEREVLWEYARKRDGIRNLKPWDTYYYAQALQRAALGFTDQMLRPYFEFENVLRGTLRHMEKMFGIRIQETKDYPVYHSDVRAFNIVNARSGNHIGVFYLDPFERPGKQQGNAWNMAIMGRGVFQGRVRQPIDLVSTRLIKGTGDEAVLLSHDSVWTLFHELGHTMHNMLSRCHYIRFSGQGGVNDDFSEFPSQFQENWAWHPDVLRGFARHYKTGEAMPDDLLEKLCESRKFLSGGSVLWAALYGWLDLSWHRARADRISSVEEFEKAAMAKFILERKRNDKTALMSPTFDRIFGGPMEGIYYNYQSTEVMAADAFTRFERRGLYDRKLCAAFKHMLEKGGTVPPKKLIRELCGHTPRQDAFLIREGLIHPFNYEAALEKAAARPANDNTGGHAKKHAAPAPAL